MGTPRGFDRDLHRARRTILGVDGFFSWMSKLVDDPDDKKYRGRNNQEVDHEGNEVAVVPGDRSGFRRISGSIECSRAVLWPPVKSETCLRNPIRRRAD
jgi:hypothetical protein